MNLVRALAPALCICAVLAGAARAEEPTPYDIEKLIRQLGAASSERRTAALRDLIRIGPRAMTALYEARGHRDPEVAVRAAALYDELANVPMYGARVSLRAEPARVKWDEPFDLHVTIKTESFGCIVPFSTGLAGLLPFSPDARQAGLVMDLADFLEVRGPTDELLDPHLFDASDDPSVLRAIQMRADGLNYARQAPHTRETTTVPALNRGRARYRMLSAGTYRVRVAFEPEWEDPLLAEARAGRSESDWIEIEVSSSAPPPVRETGAPIDIVVEREGDFIVASAVNAYDLQLRVNRNLNGGSPAYADASWVLYRGKRREARRAEPTGRFDLCRVDGVAPGGRVELSRIRSDDFDAEAVGFRYESELCRAALPALTPRIPQSDRVGGFTALPYMVAGRFESEPLSIDGR